MLLTLYHNYIAAKAALFSKPWRGGEELIMLKKLFLTGLMVIGFAAIATFNASPTFAQAILQDAYVSVSDPRTGATTTHDFYFDVAKTTLGSVRFQYCAYPSETGGNCSASGANGTDASLAQVTKGGGATDQTFTETWEGAATRFNVTSAYDAESTSAGVAWRFRFTDVVNPALNNCIHSTPTNNSTGTCYVRIFAYSQTNWGGTPDTAIVSITVTQAVSVSARVDPVFRFAVTGVAGSGATRNGTALSDVTTTVSTIPFGSLTALQPKFAAHTLTVTTNTTGGYTISAYLTGSNLTGTSYAEDIDPYVGNGANQTTPQSWTTPTGTVSGSDTGWLGVGTDDTGIITRAANAFYSLNTTSFVVASTEDSATNRTSNIVYGIEVNANQSADNYTGTLLYNALPKY